MHTTTTEILDLLTNNGVSYDTAIPVVNQIYEKIQNSTVNLSERIDNDLKIGLFTSEWDDGSSFRANCVVNLKTHTIESISTAGTASDDAACYAQYVLVNQKRYEVFDPDERDESTFNPEKELRLY